MQAGEKCVWGKGQGQKALSDAIQMSRKVLGLSWKGEPKRTVTLRSSTRTPAIGATRTTPTGSIPLMCDEHGIFSNSSPVVMKHYVGASPRVILRHGHEIPYSFDKDIHITPAT